MVKVNNLEMPNLDIFHKNQIFVKCHVFVLITLVLGMYKGTVLHRIGQGPDIVSTPGHGVWCEGGNSSIQVLFGPGLIVISNAT